MVRTLFYEAKYQWFVPCQRHDCTKVQGALDHGIITKVPSAISATNFKIVYLNNFPSLSLLSFLIPPRK
jgi:hypothetical protein